MISLVKTDTDQYFQRLVTDTGCESYLFTPTPLVIDGPLFQRLNSAVPAMLALLDTEAYCNHCVAQNGWRLPVAPMKKTDFTGCADFLLTNSSARLIEMNINLPGKVGMMQTLGEAALLFLGRPEAQWTNLHATTDLVATIRAAIPAELPVAIIVSHLPASKKHQPHYEWFSKQLNRTGMKTTVVQANTLTVTPAGCEVNGQQFGAFINLVIPFVWEDNPAEFEPLTQLWRQHARVFFPNPTGGMYGTKDLLSYLDAKRTAEDAELWSEFVLKAQPLADFNSVDELLERYAASGIVLKPLKDYDTKGVYVQPDRATVEQIFREKRDGYMVQEFTDSLQLPFVTNTGEAALSHSVIFRVFFASKQPIAYQGYIVNDAFNGRYFSAPVLVEE